MHGQPHIRFTVVGLCTDSAPAVYDADHDYDNNYLCLINMLTCNGPISRPVITTSFRNIKYRKPRKGFLDSTGLFRHTQRFNWYRFKKKKYEFEMFHGAGSFWETKRRPATQAKPGLHLLTYSMVQSPS